MPRRLPASLALLVATMPATMALGQSPAVVSHPATSRFDPRLVDLRRASAQWGLRAGPTRMVVDQVCLVPDVPTFYEALATWDEARYFPVLIDDAELVLKFLRAFRPARVVRFGRRAPSFESGQAEWARAVEAVGGAWTPDDAPADAVLKGNAPPIRLGKTPPGVVVGHPGSPSLPGLAALAAGRFQPMVRLDSARGFRDVLSRDEIGPFCARLDEAVAARVPSSARLGDDCDFLTLAGDYPYRYDSPKGPMALDDRVGRDAAGRRWAFAGRLMGDGPRAVYAAMCSLFLRPGSAVLFDGYSETNEPWKYYSLRPASIRLASVMPAALVIGERRATPKGWHEVFDPVNRAGLVFVNSHGSPQVFNLIGAAHALDIMPSAPTAVSMIHSFSAADPTDPDTIAGRWLTQGAFLYFGAMDEPYLNSFRLPGLVAELLAAGYPFAAAHRPTRDEPWGEPWKLVVLGDPLYTLVRTDGERERERSHDFPASASWVPYTSTPPPTPDAPEVTRLAWSVNAALIQTTAGAVDTSPGILAVLRSIERGRLDPAIRPVFDALLSVLLYEGRQYDGLIAAVGSIPKGERSPAASRLALAAMLTKFDRALGRQDFEGAAAAWSELAGAGIGHEFLGQMTGRLGATASTPSLREAWRRRLRAALSTTETPPARAALSAELKRVDEIDRPGR